MRTEKIKDAGHYQVIVAGGGPAGTAAAIAAARNGAKTLLIEKEGYLGGMATGASVPAFCTFTDGRDTIIRGIGLEILNALKQCSWKSPFYDRKPGRTEGLDWLPIDSEALKRVLDGLAEASGCRLLYHTSLIDCVRDGDRIREILIHNKSGIQKLSGDILIDCTGDGDLAFMAGCQMESGDEEGQVQAGTLCFKIANFNTQKFMAYAEQCGENGNLENAVKRARADGRFPAGEIKVAGVALCAPGMASFNFGHVYGWDPTDGDSLTRAEIEARRRLPELMEFIRSYVPGGENAVLALSGPCIGVRESRRLCGQYCLTIEDYEKRADFPDSIACYSYPVDIHASGREDLLKMEMQYRQTRYRPGESYGIPYRCLLPREVGNLLVAGRSVSCDRSMQASLRVMPACFAMGQAAGTAAAMASAEKLDASGVDIVRLRERLKEQGAYLKEYAGCV